MSDVMPVQTFQSDNRSVSDTDAHSDNSVDNIVSTGATEYGATTFASDKSVGSMLFGFSPTIVKGATSQKGSTSASQTGEALATTLVKVAIPALIALVAVYLTRDKSTIDQFGRW